MRLKLSPDLFFNNQRLSRLFSSQRKVRAILNGTFDYNQSFATFLKSTHQKKESASVVGFFIQRLQEKQVLLQKPTPLAIADIGCADSSTCLQYLKNINYSSGFNYFGIDTNQNFLTEARKKLSHEPMIKKFNLIKGDAFSGKLKEFSLNSFEFIFVSHIAYYIKDKLTSRIFLEDVIKLLVKQCGIAVFLHEDSTFYFRSTYNKNLFNTLSTPQLLEQTARQLPANFNQFKSIRFTSKLQFSPLTDELWEKAKYPQLYKNFANEKNFIDTLEKLAFIVQCDLIDLAKENSLARYVDEIKDAIRDNNHCLDLETHIQTLVAPQCGLKHIIAKVLKETEEALFGILNSDALINNQLRL